MRRLAVTAAVLGSLALTHAGAGAAGTPTLDGKRTKTLSASFSPKAQDNDKDIASISGSDRTQCAAARCGRLPFLFKPARGVRGNLSLAIAWSVPGEDFDLYLAEIARDGSYSEVTSCGTFAGTSEKIVIPGSDLRPGKKYALVADFYRTAGADKVSATVAFPSKDAIKTTVPLAAEGPSGFKLNCGLG